MLRNRLPCHPPPRFPSPTWRVFSSSWGRTRPGGVRDAANKEGKRRFRFFGEDIKGARYKVMQEDRRAETGTTKRWGDLACRCHKIWGITERRLCDSMDAQRMASTRNDKETTRQHAGREIRQKKRVMNHRRGSSQQEAGAESERQGSETGR